MEEEIGDDDVRWFRVEIFNLLGNGVFVPAKA
jgi:hypothetical protein